MSRFLKMRIAYVEILIGLSDHREGLAAKGISSVTGHLDDQAFEFSRAKGGPSDERIPLS